MNKFLLIPVLILMSFNFVSGISSDLKPIYQPGETLIIELSGEILSPISNSDVEFKTGKYGNVDAPMEHDLSNLEGRYFIYALLPSDAEKNYTLVINDIQTTVDGQVKSIDFKQNFSTSLVPVEYAINPGFINAGDEFDFTITLNNDSAVLIPTTLPGAEELSLSPGQNKFSFSSENFEQGLSFHDIGIYTLPIYLDKSSTGGQPNTNQTDSDYNLAFFPRIIESTTLKNRERVYPFRLTNLGRKIDNNIELIYNSEIFSISPSYFNALEENESLEFNLTLKPRSEDLEETIIFKVDEDEFRIPIVVRYTEDETQVTTPYLQNYTEDTGGYFCSELDGEFCATGESCSGNTVETLDGSNCCVGSCKASSTSNYGWIGYLIGAILLIGLVIIGGRYLKTRKQRNPLEKRLAKRRETRPSSLP